MLLKSKQTLTTRREKDRTVRDRQPKLLRTTWATDQRGPRGKPRPRTESPCRKKRPARNSGPDRKASLSLTQCESSPRPQARIPNRHDSSTEEFGACHADLVSTPHDSMRCCDHSPSRFRHVALLSPGTENWPGCSEGSAVRARSADCRASRGRRGGPRCIVCRRCSRFCMGRAPGGGVEIGRAHV